MKVCLKSVCVRACRLMALTIMTGCLSGSGESPAVAAKSNPATDTVEIRQMAFVPQEISVKKGNKIVFINRDLMTHDITEESGRLLHSPQLRNGESWSFTAKETVRYFCSIHPVMKGSITVK